ncbi:MAG: hypothetical protein EXR81_05985 [Gammaproteobacteria bacterium]|nr:hypothetical protein [Gammaproteobacteria bacterium]
MKDEKDTLVINTNPYMRDPKAFAEVLCKNVETSSAVEGINVEITTYLEDGKYKFKVKHRGK